MYLFSLAQRSIEYNAKNDASAENCVERRHFAENYEGCHNTVWRFKSGNNACRMWIDILEPADEEGVGNRCEYHAQHHKKHNAMCCECRLDDKQGREQSDKREGLLVEGNDSRWVFTEIMLVDERKEGVCDCRDKTAYDTEGV